MQNIAILGSTGSIGSNTLAVIKKNPEHYRAYVLVGNKNVEKMLIQYLTFRPHYVAMADEDAAKQLRKELKKYNVKADVESGIGAICDLVAMPDVDQVMAAIVGAAGLLPTLSAIKRGKRILLANKESLVTCGSLFMQAMRQYKAELLPVDSEHNAIFQSMPKSVQTQLGFCHLADNGITKIVLTGSGGPFRDKPISLLANVSISEAITHPNWSMGKKISVDSATMMNKGLEYIEARWLFNASADQIEVIIHPQSIIHSMVRYIDGSIIAQLGTPDMCTPIACALSYPKRIGFDALPLDFYKLAPLTFYRPDLMRYPCLKLAISAFDCGQAATTVLNVANEVAVDAFLNHRINFVNIATFIEAVLTTYMPAEPTSIEDVLNIDNAARRKSEELLKSFHVSP